VQSQELRIYQTAAGERPFAVWLDALADRQAQIRIQVRLARLALGNPGDAKALSGGLWELRVDQGPGYRVYYARIGATILLLLCGGDKAAQQEDIERAKTYLEDYRSRTAPAQGPGAQAKTRKRAVRRVAAGTPEKPRRGRRLPRSRT
jgi:putative addiction module killer protein